MKTVLHVIDTTGPGGAETVFVTLAAGLDPGRYRSLALIRGPGWVQAALSARGIKTVLLDCKGSFNVRYLLQLIALIRAERVDVIQAHLLGSGVYCALAGLLVHRPVVVTFHGVVDVSAGERFVMAKVALLRLGARRIVAVSRELAAQLVQRLSLPAARATVIHNGISVTDFDGPRLSRLRQQLNLPAGALLIGALGNIRAAKDYPNLLDAFAKVVACCPDSCLVIAGQGDGRLLAELEARRIRLGLVRHVHFLGFVDDPAEYLRNLDVFVLSSSTEGFSIATIQAMAAGTPVVATSSGGPQEIVSAGENGILVPPSDPQAMADALLELIRSPERRHSMASAARSTVKERFDIRTMVESYQAIYGQLMPK
jgi:glycosyltransferase involved in cell wall biosynthesis